MFLHHSGGERWLDNTSVVFWSEVSDGKARGDAWRSIGSIRGIFCVQPG